MDWLCWLKIQQKKSYIPVLINSPSLSRRIECWKPNPGSYDIDLQHRSTVTVHFSTKKKSLIFLKFLQFLSVDFVKISLKYSARLLFLKLDWIINFETPKLRFYIVPKYIHQCVSFCACRLDDIEGWWSGQILPKSA